MNPTLTQEGRAGAAERTQVWKGTAVCRHRRKARGPEGKLTACFDRNFHPEATLRTEQKFGLDRVWTLFTSGSQEPWLLALELKPKTTSQ